MLILLDWIPSRQATLSLLDNGRVIKEGIYELTATVKNKGR